MFDWPTQFTPEKAKELKKMTFFLKQGNDELLFDFNLLCAPLLHFLEGEKKPVST